MPGQRVLDVGCGPGALTAELVARLGPESVAAVDPSAPFVEAARVRHPGVDVRHASAEALPFADRSFDAALAQLVVHFMADPIAGLAEMGRVTRRGGVVAACVWDHAGGLGPLGLFWDVARTLDPTVTDESQLAGARQGHLDRTVRGGQPGRRHGDHADRRPRASQLRGLVGAVHRGRRPGRRVRDEPGSCRSGRAARALSGPPAERAVRGPGACVGGTRRGGVTAPRPSADEEVHPRPHGADDQHDHVGGQQQQAGVQVQLDVHAHDGHQRVRVVVVGGQAA